MNNNNRLGCLTGTGFFAALITFFVLVGVAFASGSQMFSSGALNAQPGESIGGVTSHADIKECKACHSAPWERATMADRCLECHTNIAAQMVDVAQLHGSIVQKSPSIACRDCHQDHRGATASLTELGNFDFPHEALGFSLNEHQRKESGDPITCEDCHGDDVTTFASDSCQTCHSDMDIAYAQAHLLSFGGDCLACHDGVDRFDDFNHNAYPFKLEGGHANVACTQCHLDARSITDLQSAPQDCYSCHAHNDEHNGQYGTQCESCHNPSTWEDAIFDHNLSAFKLEGEHTEVACEECHVNNIFKGTPKDCYSCHAQDDEHNGQYGTQCESCHVPTDWENATFDHSLTNFPLNGGHSNVDCEQCHTTTGSFGGLSTACASCHQDPAFHAGAFGTACESCHSINAWSPAQFNISHPEPRVDEEGSGIYHGGASCRDCHPSSVFQSSCISCHEGNNFDDEGGEGGGDDDDD
ncbi:MAG: hypothetical protein J0L96_18940 [Anaerolineae bacterium]|nr:hypothetical protein [Anaerolineae bacterium]